MGTPQTINDGVPGLGTQAVIFSDRARGAVMAAAWDAYRGVMEDPLKIEPGQTNDNVKSNRFAAIVDKGVSFLFGQKIKVTISDPTTTVTDATSPQQTYLDKAWGDDDDRMTLLSKLAINGAICGHAFVKIIPPQPKKGIKYPRLIIMDPQNVTVQTDPDDCDTVQSYTIEYACPNPMSGQPARKRQVIARTDPDGMAAEYGSQDTDDTWTITNSMQINGVWQPQGMPQVWPHPFAPIVDCQNMPNPNEFWGMPDLSPDLIEMGRVLNFVNSNISRILKFFAQPWVWAKNTNASQINVTPGRIIVVPGQNAELNTLEMHSDMASSMNFAASLRSDMDEQSRVPGVALGRLESLPKGTISGVALQLLFQPLIEKTIMKQRLYGKLIREVSRIMLALGGMSYDTDIEIAWPNLLPIDDTAAAQTALILEQLGVSKQTLLAELGYDYDTESSRSTDEAGDAMTNYLQGSGPPPKNLPPMPGSTTAEQNGTEQTTNASTTNGGNTS